MTSIAPLHPAFISSSKVTPALEGRLAQSRFNPKMIQPLRISVSGREKQTYGSLDFFEAKATLAKTVAISNLK